MRISDKAAEKNDLRSQTLHAVGWKYATVVGQFTAQFTVTVILSRLLSPAEFGLVGLATIVIGLGRILTELGIGPSLIQRQEITNRHIRVGFTISMMLGVLFYLITYFGAPMAAWVFENPAVIPVLQKSAFLFIFSAIGVVSIALLRKRLDFRSLFWVDIIGYTLGYGVVAISMARMGFGVWSLVAGSLVQVLTTSLLAYGYTRHSLLPLWSWNELRELAGFSVGMTATQIANYFALQGDYFVAGRVLGTTALGLYTRSYQLMRLPTRYFVEVLSQVLFPTASRLQNDKERLLNVHRLAVGSIGLIMFPLLACVIIMANEIVVGIFGLEWREAVPSLQILALAGPFQAITHINASFDNAKGKVYSLFWRQVIYGATVIIAGWYGARYWGINGIAVAVVIASLVMFALIAQLTIQTLESSLHELLDALRPAMFVTAVSIALCIASRSILTAGNQGPLLVLAETTAMTAVGMGLMLWYTPPSWLSYLPSNILRTFEGIVPVRIEGVYLTMLNRLSRPS
ncbi:MAG: lipopolysaccharide biosynthesis protein [Caldilineaceae bacterium]|nr:lipopolysaccharide biosynthesis protein [Caldilineaceae bacterium]